MHTTIRLTLATALASLVLLVAPAFAAALPVSTATTLTVAPVSGVYGGPISLSATLKASVSGTPLSGKTIIFSLNNIPVGSATTDGSGVATLNNVQILNLVNAGVHTGYIKALYIGGIGYTGDNGTADLTLAPKPLTVTGITASDRDYIPGNTTATINTSGAHRSGVVLLDQVNLDTTSAVGNFATPDAGVAKTVTITGITLTGSAAHNYTVSNPTTTATIRKIAQTFSFGTLADKTFGDPDFTVGVNTPATGTSFSGFGACWTTGSTVHLSAIGLCTVVATNNGDTNYNAAVPANIAQSFNVNAPSTVVYNAVPATLTPNVPSEGFQATSMSQLGDYVHLAGTDRLLKTVTVTMSDWALKSDSKNIAFCAANAANCNSTGFVWPITINVYSTHLGVNGVPDTLLATKTVSVTIPWRPEADATCPSPTQWRSPANGNCYNGMAFNATFDLSNLNVILPTDVIVGVAYNTQSWGTAPVGVEGPYNSLNVGVNANQTVYVGQDDSSDKVFLKSAWAGAYSGAGIVGVFNQDNGWAPYGTVNLQITASPVTTSSNTVVVTSPALAVDSADAVAHPEKWFFYNDKTDVLDNTLGSFVTGPATAPLQAGSAQISISGPTQGVVLGTFGLQGTSISKITSLAYSTYRSAGDPATALALQFDINSTGTGAPAHYEGRLVYEPYYTHTVSDNTWQTWNPMDNSTSGTNGNWWFSHAASVAGNGKVVTTCTQATPCTWAQIRAAFPDMSISGGTYFKAGSNWSTPFTGDVDAFVIGVQTGANVNTTSYDFEAIPGTLEITKYDCPLGTSVVRSANGVGLTVPPGCVVHGGTTFGYVHGTQSDAQGPYPELGAPITEAGATNNNGVLSLTLPANGRYLVVETDGAGNQLPANQVQGLYCIGDGDTSDNNDNQELTFVHPGSTTKCVAYDAMPLQAPTPVSPVDGIVTTTAAQTLIDWTDVADAYTPTTYFYQVSNGSAVNPDGSFVSPLGSVYGPLTDSNIPTPGTPAGVYYWHVYAQDAHGNRSPWSTTQKVTIDNDVPTATLNFPALGPGATSFQVIFNEPVVVTEAQNPANYFLNNWPGAGGSGPLTGNATVAYDAGSNTATVTFTNPAWYVSAEQQWGVRDIHDLGGNLLAPNPTAAYSSPLVAPTAPGTPSTATPTTSTTQVWSWTAATDPGGVQASGVKYYEYSISGDTSVAWTNVGTNLGVTTNLPVGSYTLHVHAVDNAGNMGDEATGDLQVTSAVIPAAFVTTDAATGVTFSDATLNGTVGGSDANPESFWVSLAPFDTSSPDIPANVFSTPVLPGVSAGGHFSDPLSLVTTQGIITGGGNGNMAPITPNTTYYYTAWANVGGHWYPGVQRTVTTPDAPAVIPPLVATPQSVSTNNGAAIAITLGATGGAGTQTFVVDSAPTHGDLTGTAPALTYTPSPTYHGADAFTFKVSNDGGATYSAPATVSITDGDTIAPVVTLIGSDYAGIPVGSSYTDLGATVTDNMDQNLGYVVSLDDGATTTPSGLTLNTAVAGLHTIFFRATDSSGNEGTTSRTVRVIAPDVQTFSAGGGGNGPVYGSFGGAHGFVLGASSSTVTGGPQTPAPSTTCSALLTTYMRIGGNNNVEDVKKLQTFLNAQLHLSIPVNGIFGASTEAAVRQFQALHPLDILHPWGITKPTGFVFQTTLRLINLMSCPTLDIPLPTNLH